MKSKFLLRFVGILCSLFSANSALAQGTAFTYQGRLNDGVNAANGSYDLTFALFPTPAGGSVEGGPLTNAPTSVSNGLFTVTLDFGASVFTGADRWLDIGVRTNGSADPYTPLVPRQQITSTPYAITAGNVTGTVAASQLSGAVPLANLPTTVLVTNGQTGVNLTGTFSGNGAGVTNVPGAVPWQTVAGTNVQAQPNTGYVVTNASQVTITLPIAPTVGNTVRVSGPGAGGWRIAQNASQSILEASLNLVAVTWTPRESTRSWEAVASSADGSRLVAVVGAGLGGQIYTSSDSGVSWAARESNRNWWAVASSADGSKLVAVVLFGQIYTSTNSGASWTPRESSRNWLSVASSADGSKLVAVNNGGQIYVSSDSGVSWIPRESSRNWVSVASSADGSKLAAVVNGFDQIYTSSDSGTNWTPRVSNCCWRSVASSADGSKLVALVNGGQIYTSSDSGVNWTARETNRDWWAVASSADGSKLAAVVIGGQIYTSSPATQATSSATTTPGTAGYLVGGQATAIELQYIGNNMFLPLSYAGTFFAD